MDDLINRKTLLNDLCQDREEGTFVFSDEQAEAAYKIVRYINGRIQAQPSVPAVPLDKLCELLAEMYHCPSSGWPSSGRACHPGCPDETFEKLCGTDCESYSDVERWRAFLTKWMEGLDDK